MKINWSLFLAAVNLLASVAVFVWNTASFPWDSLELTSSLVVWCWVNLAVLLYVLAWDRNANRGAR